MALRLHFRRARAGLLAVMALALLLRGGVLALWPGALTSDPDGYRELAANLLAHGTLGLGEVPTAYRPPLYPLLLAPCVALGSHARAAIGLLHLAVGVATVGLTYRLGRRWGLGPYGLVAALLVACDPILLNQSTLIMTETLATLLAVVGLLALTTAAEDPSPSHAAAAGASLALAALCRPTFLVWAGLAALLLPWFAATWSRRLKVVAAFTLAAAVVLSPWALRNQLQFGRPVVSTTHGGYTLLLGNNPSFYEYLRTSRWGTVWDAEAFNAAWSAQAPRAGPAAELANDRRAYAEAWGHIAEQPGTFAYACLVRLVRLWQPLPHQTHPGETVATRALRYAVGAWYMVELGLAGLALVWLAFNKPQSAHETLPAGPCCSNSGGSPLRPGQPGPIDAPELKEPGAPAGSLPVSGKAWKTWLWGLLLVASFMAVHTLYWTNMRMRSPLMPVVALAAAAGVGGIAARLYRSNLLPPN